MMHVLVTGGAGYIGSVLVPLLLERGHRVTVVDRLYFGEDTLPKPESVPGDRLRVVRADIRRVDPRVFEGANAVVDLAGISNDPACELDPELTRSINLEGARRTHRLAHAAGVQRIVFASSCSVYGHGEGTQLVETSPLHPVSLYAQCKADGEKSLLELGKATGLTVTALRFATVFGLSRRMRFDLAVNVMTKNAYAEQRVVVEGGGKQWRPFVHVKDVSEAIARTLEQPAAKVSGEVLNVGNTISNVRILNLAYRVRDAIPGTHVDVLRTDPDLRDYNVNFDKIERVLDWKPSRTIDDGIAEVLAALRSGAVDPDDRRSYTLKQYRFLVDVERAFREMSIDGHVLT
jgi:nucleoside-diphosphate-sugar epimerase